MKCYLTGSAGYPSMNTGDDGFRMLALFRYWNIIEYFFPYKHLFTKDWSEVLNEFLPEFAANKSPLDYRLTCWRLINNVHDTHASIQFQSVLFWGRSQQSTMWRKKEDTAP